jgi:hypothetical protein
MPDRHPDRALVRLTAVEKTGVTYFGVPDRSVQDLAMRVAVSGLRASHDLSGRVVPAEMDEREGV